MLPFNLSDVVSTFKSVEIIGTLYKVGMIVVVDVINLFPTFGEIVHILHDVEYMFVIKLKRTVRYRTNFCAYEVDDCDNFLYLRQSDFKSYMPLWERSAVTDGAKLISIKCML